ncbi:IFRD domain-containing protein [Pyrenophora tritici-repentis]|uniref:IFRD domain containing protein n=1 Tax=Pyrenophora tritici-repentis TaxID=45151 RepID=A0A2W1GIM3_9PLEO|nr:IFRD domain containing protein [Pyrenophora tritici-repentis]KAI0618745.1 IFRD domain-containing protein [Pyrenophora tritici-repentis]KAI1528905.1 IFRD domain containing protein [Pyrenophora tritici-repentis]KAI1530150.1 IFRD domain containing protein [Pyrenophora tritici-repentis]KAI1564054.1 IFRD domain containing protein [Pyrenophora tritici-repentis]
MRDLRKQALESHKTLSRKARSRVASTTASKTNSAVASPAQSRAASRTRQEFSDEEDFSDGTAYSTASIDDVLNSEDVDIPEDVWKTELNTRIEQITNLKRSSTDGRTESLTAYAHILMARYAKDEIEREVVQLVSSMVRSIRQETTENEAVAALKALAVTILTDDSESIYEDVSDLLKKSIQTSSSIAVKVNAIHTLGVAAFFGGAGDDEVLDIMSLFIEIIESDGASVDAQDEGNVVTAALEEWGLLATEIEDLEEETEAAMEAFVEQLESADSGVQIAAGENIALLRHDKLMHTLNELAKISTRRVSKRDRRALHSSFADIRNTVEKPSRGPAYSTALDEETGKAYGAGRMKVKINRSVEVRIDKWWKLQRLNALRRTLQGGFTYHYDQNHMVSAALPFSMSAKR